MTPGTRIGVYEVIAAIGAGGMGEVYRARDTTLDREVALKVLPALFTDDPERLARFEREAKVLASLNHPNIAQVYGFAESAIAMELVEGQSLDEMLRAAGSGLPLDRALHIVRQIATALEAAHDQGIVHRDLKPANVKVREDGTVKVLDFGLAKALASDDPTSTSAVSNSPTLTARATQMGMILGTAAYMAPEQAKGRPVDRRADVWAFGAVFFEMLAGRRAFEGDDVSDVLASVLKMEPDWSALPADLPAPVRRLLTRCLEKDPKRRLRDIGEGMLQLEESLGATSSGASGIGSPGQADSRGATLAAPPRPAWRRLVPVAITAAVTATSMVAYNRWTTPTTIPAAPVRFEHTPQAPLQLYSSLMSREVAIAPDGQTIAYTVSDLQRPPTIQIRRLDQVEAVPVRGTERAFGPFFSSDGMWVGFVDQADGATIKRVSVEGGPATTVARAPDAVYGAAWTDDGSIVFGVRGGSLQHVPDAGGTPAALTALDEAAGETGHLWPADVPGTSVIVFVINARSRAPLEGGELAALDRTSRRIARFKLSGTHPRYLPTGHVVYASADGALRAVPFDARRMEITGDPVPVLEGVGVKLSGAANFDVSRTGAMAYAGTGADAPERTLAWVDRSGRETPIAAPARAYFYARVSPDGRRLSLDVRDQEDDIWIWDVVRENLSRLTDKEGPDQYGLWTADSQRIIFSSAASGRTELFQHRPDGVGEPEQITDTASENLVPFPNAITPDGVQVIFRSGAAAGVANDLFVAPLSGERSYKKLLATEHDEKNAALSPDGRFMAFESNLSGRYEVYVRPFPDVDGGQWPVSTSGGAEPVWEPTRGREIYYLSADSKLMAVPVDVAGGVTLGKPEVLFDATPYFFGGVGRNYDVTPDGRRFVMVKRPAEDLVAPPPLTVVLNWAAEVAARFK